MFTHTVMLIVTLSAVAVAIWVGKKREDCFIGVGCSFALLYEVAYYWNLIALPHGAALPTLPQADELFRPGQFWFLVSFVLSLLNGRIIKYVRRKMGRVWTGGKQ